MSVSGAVDELIRTAQEGLESGGWALTDKDRLAVGQLVAYLHWADPAQLPPSTAVRLHDAAAQFAVASVAVEGELARTLSQVATELFTVVCSTDGRNLPRLREPTPAELSDAGAALRHLRDFLLAVQGRA